MFGGDGDGDGVNHNNNDNDERNWPKETETINNLRHAENKNEKIENERLLS